MARKLPHCDELIRELLLNLRQPVTLKQWSRMSGIVFTQCRNLFVTARRRGLLRCINADAVRQRLYFFTSRGLKERRQLGASESADLPELDVPPIDWHLYANCCHAHRSAVIRTIDQESLRASFIRRLAVRHDPRLKMSTANTRDVLYWLVKHRVVQFEMLGKRPRRFYQLTDLGQDFKRLLTRTWRWI